MGWLRGGTLIALVAGIGVVIDRQLAGRIHPDGTTLALLVLALVVAGAALYPDRMEDLIGRVSQVKVGSVELGLREVERSTVVERFPEAEEYGTAPVPPLKRTSSTEGDLNQVRNCLVQRLTWLAAELDIPDTDPATVVQNLRTEVLLEEDQAAFAMDLLTPAYGKVSSLPEPLREQYVERGWRFANRLRTSVLTVRCDAIYGALVGSSRTTSRSVDIVPTFSYPHMTSGSWSLLG